MNLKFDKVTNQIRRAFKEDEVNRTEMMNKEKNTIFINTDKGVGIDELEDRGGATAPLFSTSCLPRLPAPSTLCFSSLFGFAPDLDWRSLLVFPGGDGRRGTAGDGGGRRGVVNTFPRLPSLSPVREITRVLPARTNPFR
jgi:hypothetical protein